MNVVRLVMVSAVAVLVLAACAKKAPEVPSAYAPGAPEWVVKGSGAFESDHGKVFYGVGSASGIRNASLLRMTAQNRARNELAKILQVYTASLMKDYMASTTAGEPGISSEEQHVEAAIKTVTSQTLSGVEIVDTWMDPRTGELFTLARLDLDAFTDAIEKSRDLDAKVKDYIRRNAERLHGELDRELERMGGR
ncbi:hypothetical protein G3N55_00335 [Dissulfurirhabdus thermomarina]|uniref:Lipoprotein LPP20-like domain-containing protein n=1 Tax=Dissulfurirhabdus thermomarina TaxID=1765737 RepID=A0A6N9TPD4_DISTH|nr:LPP20 family lipoprotein [Dissulfurirhabdus thermomarina]NDY41297.1 hypothetical protein [Dissulfurirhabdus thermomarina]NMX23754.1 hypothetical protein [Dissulfurirhabdus thermomarina]